MRGLILLAIIVISGCDSPSEKIGIYTIDMQYACDCTSYRIFKVNALGKYNDKNPTAGELKKYETIETDITNSYNQQFTQKDNVLLSGVSLSGVEAFLVFRDKALQNRFESNYPYHPACHIFYFEGQFAGERLNVDENGEQDNEFFVDSYKILERFPDCEKVLGK